MTDRGEQVVGFKIEVAHAHDCPFVIDPLRERAFVLHDGLEFDRDKIGRRGGGTMWHRFRCNWPECPAVALVRWDVLSDLIDAKLNEIDRAYGVMA